MIPGALADRSTRLQAIIEDPTWRLSNIDWLLSRVTAPLTVFDGIELVLTEDEITQRDTLIAGVRTIPALPIILPVGATAPELAGSTGRVILAAVRELDHEWIDTKPHWPKLWNFDDYVKFRRRVERRPRGNWALLYSVLSGASDP